MGSDFCKMTQNNQFGARNHKSRVILRKTEKQSTIELAPIFRDCRRSNQLLNTKAHNKSEMLNFFSDISEL